MKNFIRVILLLIVSCSTAQVGINNVAPKATLDIVAKTVLDGTDGLLIPRMANFPTTNPTIDQQSMMVYLTVDLVAYTIPAGTSQNYDLGFYYWDQSIPNWVSLGATVSEGWLLEGNTGTDGGTTNFMGTIDDQPISFRAFNTQRFRMTQKGQLETFMDGKTVAIGEAAGAADDGSDNENVFVGYRAGTATTGAIVSGNSNLGRFNVGIGTDALLSNVNGWQNTAIGYKSQEFLNGSTPNSNGHNNTSIGYNALQEDVNAYNNVAVGSLSMGLSSNFSNSTAVGYRSMFAGGNGDSNVVFGANSMPITRNSNNNVAIGNEVFYKVSSANPLVDGNVVTNSVSIGHQSANTGGDGTTTFNANTIIGYQALKENAGGSNITVVGSQSGFGINESWSNFTGLGSESLFYKRAHDNIGIGYQAGYGLSRDNDEPNNMYLGIHADSQTAQFGSNSVISNSIFLGRSAGNTLVGQTDSGLLIIEHSAMANPLLPGVREPSSVTPLVYGEFDTNIFRIGGQLQIGNSDDLTAGSQYTFPTAVGTAGQVLSLDGTTGNLIWGAGGGASDLDWYETGTTTAPDAITDNITTSGNVTITNTGDTILQIIGDSDNSGEGDSPEIQLSQDGGDVSSIQLEGVTGTIAAGTQANSLVLHTRAGQSSAPIHMVANSKLNTTFKSSGQVQFNDYTTATSYTGTATSILGVDAAGNIIQEPVPATVNNVWELDGNTGTDGGTADFLGTTDNQPLAIKLNSTVNAATDFRFTDKNQLEFINNDKTVFIGDGAGASWTQSGAASTIKHTLIGYNSGTLLTGGFGNVGLGANTLAATLTTSWNTAVGTNVLQNNTAGFNTSVGGNSLSAAVSGGGNSALGYNALRLNTSGSGNTAIGRDAMDKNTIGFNNTAIGSGAMVNNIGSDENTAVGVSALSRNVLGDRNVAVGGFALGNNFPGSYNTALGYRALFNSAAGTLTDAPFVTAASNNVAIGYESGKWELGEQNVFIGVQAGHGSDNTSLPTTARFRSIFIGYQAGYNELGDDKLYIESTDSDTPLIGGDFALDRAYINIDMTAIPAAATKTLNVGGDVFASGGFVSTANTYPDYVFENYFNGSSAINEDYKFTSLSNAIAFVKENGHLPNVKSYKEIKANNMEIELGETSIKNLEKIEENFLYIAELKAENDTLKVSNEKLENDNEALKVRLNEVELQQAEILKLLKEKK